MGTTQPYVEAKDYIRVRALVRGQQYDVIVLRWRGDRVYLTWRTDMGGIGVGRRPDTAPCSCHMRPESWSDWYWAAVANALGTVVGGILLALIASVALTVQERRSEPRRGRLAYMLSLGMLLVSFSVLTISIGGYFYAQATGTTQEALREDLQTFVEAHATVVGLLALLLMLGALVGAVMILVNGLDTLSRLVAWAWRTQGAANSTHAPAPVEAQPSERNSTPVEPRSSSPRRSRAPGRDVQANRVGVGRRVAGHTRARPASMPPP